MKKKRAYILGFGEIDATKLTLVGGKAANLGELLRVEGTHVPDGFCITTDAYKDIVRESEAFHSLLDHLDTLQVHDRKSISETCAKIRELIKGIAIPNEMIHEILHHLEKAGEDGAYAVRSSATAEDLPTASFAGQQDTYLNVIGKEAVLAHVSQCWASLFSDRAVTYRIQNGFDHRKVLLAVIVQKMIFPDVSGIVFTADPLTANRQVLCIDAGLGLGEALVSGLVNADHYKVCEGRIVDKQIAVKKLFVDAVKEGGTREKEIEGEKQNSQVLADARILQLERLGRTVEAHFGRPQDIEWCFAGGRFHIVQSRPITTLYPVPQADDSGNHVYVSVGHQQMMTDAMKPLGLSFWLLTTPATMRTAGGRLFVDITAMLSSSAGRHTIINTLGKSDLLTNDALKTVVDREDFIPLVETKEPDTVSSRFMSAAAAEPPVECDPSIVADLIGRNEASVERLQQNIQTKSGTALFDFILEHLPELKKVLTDPQSFRVIMAGMNAASWINEKMWEWLGEKNAADTIAQSVPDNITSEMGLALLDVADVIRPYPDVIAYLKQVKDDPFLEELANLDGGAAARDAIRAYLGKYGVRCTGEIDITRPRWSEKPATLVLLLLSNIKNFEPGAGKRKFEQGLQEALKKEAELLDRLKRLPDGEQKATDTKRMIDVIRNYAGYREYPKYGMMRHYFVYKQALLKEAERLLQANVIHDTGDIYYLSFEELRELVSTQVADYSIISQRKADYKIYEKLTPPRVITSEGEIITGKYNRSDLPVGAIAGMAVSAGVIEGRARVILSMQDADLEEGDILVTTFTDPSWTPLFVSVKGLVTEVGGLMTHGAVIAREYGLPAVVGVERATQLIKDGQRIRVHGTEGYVEML